jgi:hypothetical protein
LFTLFQPADAVRAQFAVLMKGLNAKPVEAVSRIVGGILCLHWGLVAVGLWREACCCGLALPGWRRA